ncbi:reverse transcriptase domain-containing protein [Tanacetum coccineum]
MARMTRKGQPFHTSQGVYCYTKMPFGLKNAGATYQRLVDNAFEGQVGRNLEVYVDDLVIKSHTEDELKAFPQILDRKLTASSRVQRKKTKAVSKTSFTAARWRSPVGKCTKKGDVPLVLQQQKKLSPAHSSIIASHRGLRTTPVYFPIGLRDISAHPIMVITDQPIRQVFSKHVLSGAIGKVERCCSGETEIFLSDHAHSERTRLADFSFKKTINRCCTPRSEVKLQGTWIFISRRIVMRDGWVAGSSSLTRKDWNSLTHCALNSQPRNNVGGVRSPNCGDNALHSIEWVYGNIEAKCGLLFSSQPMV